MKLKILSIPPPKDTAWTIIVRLYLGLCTPTVKSLGLWACFLAPLNLHCVVPGEDGVPVCFGPHLFLQYVSRFGASFSCLCTGFCFIYEYFRVICHLLFILSSFYFLPLKILPRRNSVHPRTTITNRNIILFLLV